MDKMCTVQELLDSGYSCNNLTISGEGGCLRAEETEKGEG